MPISRFIVEEYSELMDDFEMAMEEARVVHRIAIRLVDEGLWENLDDFVKDAYIQNAINWDLEFY